MQEPNPFENVLEQIADLLKFAQANKAQFLAQKEKQAPLDPKIEEQLKNVEQTIEIFRKITDKALKTSGLDEAVVQSNTQEVPEDFGVRDKRILKKAKKLRGELEIVEKEFSTLHAIAKLQKKKEKMEGRKRIKKFKRLGGQGWTPL
ncbi:MAG TPA: hypothetical protein VIH61_06600 [Waddliaceae bacterium]